MCFYLAFVPDALCDVDEYVLYSLCGPWHWVWEDYEKYLQFSRKIKTRCFDENLKEINVK